MNYNITFEFAAVPPERVARSSALICSNKRLVGAKRTKTTVVANRQVYLCSRYLMSASQQKICKYTHFEHDQRSAPHIWLLLGKIGGFSVLQMGTITK